MSDTPTSEPDLGSLIRALDAAGVEYVLVGGMAARVHGASRPTQDLDIVTRGGLENLTRLAEALHHLGARIGARTVDEDDLRHFNTRWETSAGRIDVLLRADWTGGTTITYRELAPRAVVIRTPAGDLPVVSVADLVALKRAVGRDRDLEVVAELEARHGRKPTPRQPGPRRGLHGGGQRKHDPPDHGHQR